MRCFVSGVLAAFAMAVSLSAGGARAEEAKPIADPAELGYLFAAAAPVSVIFSDSEIALDADALKRLDRQAAWIASHEDVRVRVYGIAAQDGYQPRNMAMAMKRANAVMKYLVSKGVEPARIDAVVLFGNAAQPRFADSGASTVTEIVGRSMRTDDAAGATS